MKLRQVRKVAHPAPVGLMRTRATDLQRGEKAPRKIRKTRDVTSRIVWGLLSLK